jgi:phage shock protein PspC (stress-responsive transcriptional regulator)
MVKSILDFFEKHAFGVFTWWGEKLGVNSQSIRLFFIYLSFLTFGSPLIVYLIMAFVLQNKHYFKPPSRKTIWEI